RAQIAQPYRVQSVVAPGPVVTLNRAVAVAVVDGAAAGLDLLATLEGGPRAGHHRVAAVRAHLPEMAGERAAPRAAYREAARGTAGEPARRGGGAGGAAVGLPRGRRRAGRRTGAAGPGGAGRPARVRRERGSNGSITASLIRCAPLPGPMGRPARARRRRAVRDGRNRRRGAR